MINNDNIIIAHGAEDLLSSYKLKKDDTVVFIDALRASNTVLAALHCGARKIKLFSDYEEALRFKADDRDIICIGEIDAGDIKGFDFNNSPSRIIGNCGIFRDAVIAMATTNFTRAVTRTYDACCTKLIGTLLNKKALKDYLGEKRTPYGRIFLLAVGRKGKKAVEDDATAEYLREFLTGGTGGTADMKSIYRASESAENIRKKGYGEDIDFCLKEDFVATVPEILGDEIHKPGGDKTSDIIIVPPLVKDLVLEDYFTGKAEVLVLTNKTVQDGKVIFPADSVGKTASLDDYINVAKMLHLNEDAKSVYTDWCRNGFVCERLAFEGVNLAGLFYIELIYYFIGVLKALAVSERIVAEYPESRFFLVDDGSFWARSFSGVAKKHGSETILLKYSGGKKTGISAKKIFVGAAKKILSMVNLLIIRLKGDGPAGGRKIIYSCALKFMEPLLDETHGRETVYYLRPVFSLKAFRMGLKKSAGRLLHVLPEYFLSFRERLSLRSKVNPEKISAEVDDYFKKAGGLNYKGFDLWKICGPDISAFLRKELRGFAEMVSGFNKMIESANPGLLINDEDTTPFNKALVECAKKKGVPSIQMNHGILGHHLLKVPINSDVIAVFGESSSKRLMSWGVEKNKIALTGAPCYSKISAPADGDRIKKELCSRLGLPGDVRLVVLASSPFRTEERSDFIDTFLIPSNIAKVVAITAMAVDGLENAKLIIKLHPREKNEWFTRDILRKHGFENKVIILRDYDISSLLNAGDLILSYGTTVFLEALLVKKPVLIFDDGNKKFLNFLSDDFLDLLDDEGSIRRIRKILQDPHEREDRLRKQEKELLWHFINKNEDSVERFHKLCDGMLAGAAERKAE